MGYDEVLRNLAMQGITPSNNGNIIEESQEISAEDKLINDMQEISGIVYSDEQKTIIKHHGSMCILACAGSGKTSVLTHLLAKRILNREITDTSKVVCTTYSKAGADEMNIRLNKLLDNFGIRTSLKIKTLHAFFLELIRTFGINSEVISESKRIKLINEACKEANFNPKDDELSTINNLLSYQINCLLRDSDTVASQANTIEDLTVEQYTNIRRGYDLRKRKNNLIDFDDMQTYLYKWLCKDINSSDENTKNLGISVRNYCKAMWTEFYIDEAQDVSKIQFDIIKAIVTNPEDQSKLDRTLVFIGDDDQCIYTWRGADPSIILGISPMFGIPTYALSTNYRCKNEIVDYATTSVKFNNARYNKGMTSNIVGGNVRIAQSKSGDIFDMSKIACDYIKKLIDSNVKQTDIAVMARNNFHLAILSNMLLEGGIYCSMSNDIKLTNNSMYKDLKMILDITDETWKPKLTADILWKVCIYLGVKGARFISTFQDNACLSLSDTLGYMLKNYEEINDIPFDKKLNIPPAVDATGREQWRRLSRETVTSILYLYTYMVSEVDKAKAFKGICDMYCQSSAFMYKTQDRSRAIRSLIYYMQDVINRNGIEKAKSFFKMTEQLEQGTMTIPGPKVTLTTIHGAKGKEWKHVIMLACDNVSMPSMDSINKLITQGENISDINKYIDEERRLHYVESTRAKEDLLIISNGTLSLFTLESLGFFKNSTNTNDIAMQVAQGNMSLDSSLAFADNIVNNKESKYYYDGTIR